MEMLNNRIYIYLLPGGYAIYGETCLQRNRNETKFFVFRLQEGFV
jgi:hypothetical protein